MREGRPLNLMGDAAASGLYHRTGDGCWRGGPEVNGVVIVEKSSGRGARGAGAGGEERAAPCAVNKAVMTGVRDCG